MSAGGWWVPFPVALLSDPRVRAVSLAARGVLASLVVQAEGGAVLPYVAGHGAEGTVALVALREGAPASPGEAVGSEVWELQKVGLLSWDDEARELRLHLSAEASQRQPSAPRAAPAAGGSAPEGGARKPPSHASAAQSERAARHYFKLRERRWHGLPEDMTWEQWLKTPDGVKWEQGRNNPRGAATTPRNNPQQGSQQPCNKGCNNPCNNPLHVSLKGLDSSEKTDKEREEGARAREAQQPPQQGLQQPPATTPLVAADEPTVTLEALDLVGILVKASGGCVKGLGAGPAEAAVAATLRRRCPTVGDLESFARAIRDRPRALWPDPKAGEALARNRGVTIAWLAGWRTADGYECRDLVAGLDAWERLRSQPQVQVPWARAERPASPPVLTGAALAAELEAARAKRFRPAAAEGASP